MVEVIPSKLGRAEGKDLELCNSIHDKMSDIAMNLNDQFPFDDDDGIQHIEIYHNESSSKRGVVDGDMPDATKIYYGSEQGISNFWSALYHKLFRSYRNTTGYIELRDGKLVYGIICQLY